MATEISFASVSSGLLHPATATLFAFVGIALGYVICKIVRFQISFLAAGAIGTLLAMTLYNVLPNAKQFVNWPTLLVGCASGYVFLWIVGKYIYRVSRAYAIREPHQDTSRQFSRIAVLLGIVFAFYAVIDGISIVFGDNLLGSPDLGLLFSVSVHKIPEGLALILFLLSAGCGYKKAILWAASVEGLILAGSIFGFYYAGSVSTLWLGLLFAHVAGGFFYLLVTTAGGMLTQHYPAPRYALHLAMSSLSFLSSSLVLVLAKS